MSTLHNTDRLILISDPLFLAQIGTDASSNGIHNGWHGVEMSDNVLYCDGSARFTSAKGVFIPGDDPNDRRKIGDNYRLMTRGPTWAFDTYPTHGARIWGGSCWSPPNWSCAGDNKNHWPYSNAQNNMD